ncbi:hypothetical protein [uncultured Paraglaciecola sp.]|uniref:hypothetical protein n=1 Tax=uncultured Paraglaciecola sp. TaxID=1765024 RepID=UPI0025F5FF49|nr:hypothetical protein [uncultured Paraglaciecola sp.]
MNRFQLIYVLLFSILIVSCGGGGSSTPTNPPPIIVAPPVIHSVEGMAVKGPLINAKATLYKIDVANGFLKGAEIDTGTTDSQAKITGLAVSEPLDEHYLIEISVVDETIDINSGTLPVMSTLLSIISKEQLVAKQSVNTTPLTTLALKLTA